jgi:sucrose-6-phosphate hydrolase SacC (GH32 family)
MKWVLYGASGRYYVGEFDGKAFKPEGKITRFNYGNCFYASQTFNNIPPEDGRRIQIGWGQVAIPGMPFNQMMTFPTELTLRTSDEGIRMFAYPVEEIKKIHGKEHTWSDVQLSPGQDILSTVEGELFDISAEFEVGDADEFGFFINGFKLAYNVEDKELVCIEQNAPLKSVDGKIRLRFLVDRVSIEIFANDGRVYMPVDAIPEQGERGLKIFTKGGKTKVNELKVVQLHPIWN